MKPWMTKLQKVAKAIAREKPVLHFLGLVPHPELPDRWDLLVCSDNLDHRGIEGVRYLSALLKKNLLVRDQVKITMMIIMPHDKATIKRLEAPGEFKAERLHSLYRFDEPNEVIVLWPEKFANAELQTA